MVLKRILLVLGVGILLTAFWPTCSAQIRVAPFVVAPTAAAPPTMDSVNWKLKTSVSQVSETCYVETAGKSVIVGVGIYNTSGAWTDSVKEASYGEGEWLTSTDATYYHAELWLFKNLSAGAKYFTAWGYNATSKSQFFIAVYEVSGVSTTDPLRDTSFFKSTPDANQSTLVLSTVLGDICISFSTTQPHLSAWQSGQTEIFVDSTEAGGGAHFNSAYKTATGTTTQMYSGFATSNKIADVGVALKP